MFVNIMLSIYVNIECVNDLCNALTKIIGEIGEKYGFYPKCSQNENIWEKMGELFVNFVKHILILRTFRNQIHIFLQFAYDFCQCVLLLCHFIHKNATENSFDY